MALIDKQTALDALMEKRERLLDHGQAGAEHILTHCGYNVIDELPPVQSDVPDIYAGELISRQAAMERLMAQNVIMDGSEYHNGFNAGVNRAQEVIKNLPPVQPTITHEQAIDYLHETGWLQNHDRILTESKIVPPVQPKRGEWEYHSNPNIGINPEDAYCSCCGFHVDTTENVDFDEYNFCPRCGAKMER